MIIKKFFAASTGWFCGGTMANPKRSRFFMASCLTWILVFGSYGCTKSIKQSAGLAQVGTEYSKAMIALLEVTVDKVIEDDSETLLYQQRLTSYTDKDKEREELQQFLKGHDVSVLKIIDPLGRLQNHARTLQVYFLNLQALAETDAPARASVAVAELSESINIANDAMNEKDEVVITDTQKRALKELAKSVTRGVQAVQLNNALRRDAPIIGEQLLLHEEVLRKVSGILKHTFDKSMALLKKNEVYRPYVTKTISNKQKWMDTRKRILTGTFFHQGLDSAVEASQKMQIVWAGLVEGKEDLASIQLILDDIREFALLVRRLREAAESKGGGNE